MSFNKGRGDVQYVRSKFKKFSLAEVVANVSATFLNLIDLPPDAILTRGYLGITQVFNSTSSDAITVGDGTTGNRYLTSTSVQALGLTALVPTGVILTTKTLQKVGITWTSGGGTPTTGQGWLFVEYIIPGQGDEFFLLP
jgi:hypothetical protein